MLIALDTNVFIYVLESDRQLGTQALALLKAVESGDIEAVASELVYLETLANSKLRASDIDSINRLLEYSGVEFQPIDKTVLLEAARLRRTHDIKTPDAIHIASAQRAKANYFVTNDKQLLGNKIGGIELIPINEALLLGKV